jgi:ribosomal protein L23
MRKYCVIKENESIRSLLSLIKSNYVSEKSSLIREVNIFHVTNRIYNADIKKLVKDLWHDLEIRVGHPIMLLENNNRKNIIERFNKKNKCMSFIIKVKADESSNDIFDSIYNASKYKIELRELSI